MLKAIWRHQRKLLMEKLPYTYGAYAYSGVMRVHTRPGQAQGRQNRNMEWRGGQDTPRGGGTENWSLANRSHIQNIRAAQTELDGDLKKKKKRVWVGQMWVVREGLWSGRSWRRGKYNQHILMKFDKELIKTHFFLFWGLIILWILLSVWVFFY